ncbi:MAG: hypothetical protein HXL69_07555 [Dialister invisus]|nr:hypothetical protein [Dialister invisus]MBF1122072.1 hypothetical protein [Dialister invisus]
MIESQQSAEAAYTMICLPPGHKKEKMKMRYLSSVMGTVFVSADNR